MDGHASPDELPELNELLGSFQVRFRRPEGAAALERYTTGLLTELPTQNCDTIAQAVPGTSAQRLQEFLTNMPWDEADLNRQQVQKMVAEATLGDGVLVLDNTGFPKQGKASVGVARQYSGTLGKVGNCQLAVTCCDTELQATWPAAVRLPLPKAWAEDSAHRGTARADFRMSLQRKATSPAQRADQRLQALPRWQWRTLRWRRGTTGWRRKKFVAVRCWRVTHEGQRHVGWLLGESTTRSQPEERQYSWSHLPASATVEEVGSDAHRRYAVEPFHEAATGEVGWEQDQGGCGRASTGRRSR
jgi:hypothetical protein